jgi:hypothetical protein
MVQLFVFAVTGSSVGGWVTLFPCGQTPPETASVNFGAGQTVSNSVSVRLGTSGKLCVFSSSATHVIADLNGAHSAGSPFVGVAPARFMDTRPGFKTVEGVGSGAGMRTAGSVTELPVTGRAGVPTDASSVVLNVAVTGSSSGGWITVYPCGQQPPETSTVNFSAGQTISNSVNVKPGPGGKVCIATSSATHVIADLNGYQTAA